MFGVCMRRGALLHEYGVYPLAARLLSTRQPLHSQILSNCLKGRFLSLFPQTETDRCRPARAHMEALVAEPALQPPQFLGGLVFQKLCHQQFKV